MIAPSLPAAGAPAPTNCAPAAHDVAGGESGDGFAGLMTPASRSANAATAAGEADAAGAAGDTARDDSEAGDENTATESGTSLAERLLALIGASATPAAQAPAPAPGSNGGPPPSLAPGRPQPAPGALMPGIIATGTGEGPAPMAAATGLPLDPAGAGTGASQPAAVAGTGPLSIPAFSAAPAAATPGTPSATTAVASTGTMLADLAQAVAPAVREPAREAGAGRESLELAGIGDRGPLLASGPAATARPVTAPAAAAALAMPANPDAGFDDGFGARIGWMAEQRIGRAELRINPEHLGTIDVRLQMDGTRVSAEFQSPHAEVRQALEQSVGRLRDMLGQHGMQLAQANVGHGGGGGRDGQPASPQGANGSTVTDDGFVEMPAAATPIHSRGLLDEYA